VSWQSFLSIFITVFLAEIGDKTQLTTMLFSAQHEQGRWLVFLSAALALVLAAAVGVVLGGQLARIVSPQSLKLVAGVGFVAVGVWTIMSR
jgi:putative Ca2+/H+ antiporter (TMEM165/GDT1 family)